MDVTLHSTDAIVELQINGTTVPARVWEGITAKGIRCHAYITRIAVHRSDDAEEFDRDLRETRPLTPEVASVIPARLVL